MAITRTITVTGRGWAEGQPDTAWLTLGVEHADRSLAAAFAATSEAMRSVTESLLKANIESKDIGTSGISVSQRYLPEHDRKPRQQEYVVSNTVSVTIRDLDRLGTLLTEVVDRGANRVDSLRFGFANISALAAEARARAALDALERAGELASALNVRLGRPLYISDGTPVTPVVDHYEEESDVVMARMVPSMPVSEGTVGRSARVQVVFEIEPMVQ
jgi:uncharacterized protein